MPSQDPRAEVRVIQDEIDRLNHEKGPLQAAWDEESRGMSMYALLGGKDEPSTLVQLKAVNKRLSFLYGQRNALLAEYPDLQREFGTPVDAPAKRYRATDRLETRAARTAEDRHKRLALMHPGFKAWCAAQRPQIKGSLENWEHPEIRKRFLAEQAPTPPVASTAAAAPLASPSGTTNKPTVATIRGPVPSDFNEFLIAMSDRRANRSHNALEDYWQSDSDIRALYAVWRQERA